MESKMIDGVTFTVTPFTFFKAQKLQLKVAKIAAPLISKLVGSLGDNVKSLADAKIDGNSLSDAFRDLFKVLDEDTYVSLLKEILEYTTAQFKDDKDEVKSLSLSKETSFDIVFKGRNTLVYKAMAFVAEVNFPDFFKMGESFGLKTKEILSSSMAET